MLILLLASVLGCNGDDDDTGSTFEPDMLTVHLELGWRDVGFSHLDGATVALDDGDGNRTEVVTDGEGNAVFEVDWSLGPVDVTIDPGVQGQSLISYLDVTEDIGDIEVFYADDAVLEDRVTAYGTVAQRKDDTFLLVESFGAAGGYYQANTPSWSVDVLPEMDFELVALEFDYSYAGVEQGVIQTFYNWTRLQVDPLQRDTEVDLVLTDEATPSTFEVSYLLPDDLEDRLYRSDTNPYVICYDFTGGQLGNTFGWPTWVDIGEDGSRFEATVEYLQPDVSQDMATMVRAVGADWSYGSLYVGADTPDDWAEEVQLLPLPKDIQVTTNELGTWTVGFAEPGVDAVANFDLLDAEGSVLWMVVDLDGLTVVVPEPPSSVDAAQLVDDSAGLRPYLWQDPFGDVLSYSWAEVVEF